LCSHYFDTIFGLQTHLRRTHSTHSVKLIGVEQLTLESAGGCSTVVGEHVVFEYSNEISAALHALSSRGAGVAAVDEDPDAPDVGAAAVGVDGDADGETGAAAAAAAAAASGAPSLPQVPRMPASSAALAAVAKRDPAPKEPIDAYGAEIVGRVVEVFMPDASGAAWVPSVVTGYSQRRRMHRFRMLTGAFDERLLHTSNSRFRDGDGAAAAGGSAKVGGSLKRKADGDGGDGGDTDGGRKKPPGILNILASVAQRGSLHGAWIPLPPNPADMARSRGGLLVRLRRVATEDMLGSPGGAVQATAPEAEAAAVCDRCGVATNADGDGGDEHVCAKRLLSTRCIECKADVQLVADLVLGAGGASKTRLCAPCRARLAPTHDCCAFCGALSERGEDTWTLHLWSCRRRLVCFRTFDVASVTRCPYCSDAVNSIVQLQEHLRECRVRRAPDYVHEDFGTVLSRVMPESRRAVAGAGAVVSPSSDVRPGASPVALSPASGDAAGGAGGADGGGSGSGHAEPPKKVRAAALTPVDENTDAVAALKAVISKGAGKAAAADTKTPPRRGSDRIAAAAVTTPTAVDAAAAGAGAGAAPAVVVPPAPTGHGDALPTPSSARRSRKRAAQGTSPGGGDAVGGATAVVNGDAEAGAAGHAVVVAPARGAALLAAALGAMREEAATDGVADGAKKGRHGDKSRQRGKHGQTPADAQRDDVDGGVGAAQPDVVPSDVPKKAEAGPRSRDRHRGARAGANGDASGAQDKEKDAEKDAEKEKEKGVSVGAATTTPRAAGAGDGDAAAAVLSERPSKKRPPPEPELLPPAADGDDTAAAAGAAANKRLRSTSTDDEQLYTVEAVLDRKRGKKVRASAALRCCYPLLCVVSVVHTSRAYAVVVSHVSTHCDVPGPPYVPRALARVPRLREQLGCARGKR
jgi:hypothetical protein